MAEHPDLPVELVDLARQLDSEAQIADRPGQLGRLEAIATRLRDLSGYAETAEILADPDMMAAIREGQEAVARGDVVGHDELVAALSSGEAATPNEPTEAQIERGAFALFRLTQTGQVARDPERTWAKWCADGDRPYFPQSEAVIRAALASRSPREEDEPRRAPCSKCGTVECAEDAASGWYDLPDIVDARPAPSVSDGETPDA